MNNPELIGYLLMIIGVALLGGAYGLFQLVRKPKAMPKLVGSDIRHTARPFPHKGTQLWRGLELVEDIDRPREDDGTPIECPFVSFSEGGPVPYKSEEAKSLIERHDAALEEIERLRIQLDQKDALIGELTISLKARDITGPGTSLPFQIRPFQQLLWYKINDPNTYPKWPITF